MILGLALDLATGAVANWLAAGVTLLARGAVFQLLGQKGAKFGAERDNGVAVSGRGGEGDRAHSSVTIGQNPGPPASSAASARTPMSPTRPPP